MERDLRVYKTMVNLKTIILTLVCSLAISAVNAQELLKTTKTWEGEIGRAHV